MGVAEVGEYVKVVMKVSYNRGADLLACLVGARVGIRDCEAGLGRATEIVQGFGVPGTQSTISTAPARTTATSTCPTPSTSSTRA